MLNINTFKDDLILIADDDIAARQLLRRVMESDGYLVEEAADGTEAFKKYSLRQPSIVLLDALMSEGSGFEFCTTLKRLPEEQQVPVITSLDDQSSIDQAFEAGAVDYITKPIHWPVLRWLLRQRWLQ